MALIHTEIVVGALQGIAVTICRDNVGKNRKVFPSVGKGEVAEERFGIKQGSQRSTILSIGPSARIIVLKRTFKTLFFWSLYSRECDREKSGYNIYNVRWWYYEGKFWKASVLR